MGEEKRMKVSKLEIGVGVVFLALSLAFFYLLGTVTQDPARAFGFSEVLFSIVIGVVVLLFLVWLKEFMESHPYLGLILGVIALGAAEYSLTHKFTGPYTTAFAISSAVVVLAYITYHFIIYKKNASKNEGETFDDS